MSKNILDEKDKIIKNDPQNMLSCIDEMPMQIRDCWENVKKFIIPAHYVNIKNIIILGMGGSAIGGDLVKSLATNSIKIPIYVCREYNLPEFANQYTLVIASSYSGNTEETISAFSLAAEKGCKLLAITTGGKIADIAKKYNAPIFKINYNSQPRAALGYSLISIIGILSKLGIFSISDREIASVLNEFDDLYAKINLDIPTKKNQAKDLASKIQDSFVLIVGSGYLTEVAHRIKTQINENSKQVAFYDSLPELNHNTIVGFDYPKEIQKNLFIILLQSKYDHPRVKLRQQIMVKILAKKKIRFESVMFTPSANPLSEMFKVIFFGDYLSYYLGVLNHVDPTPVETINFLKDKLAEIK